MRTDYAEIMLGLLKQKDELSGFDIIRSEEYRELGYPVERPLAVIGGEAEKELGCLLGCDDGLFGGEMLDVSVMTDEEHGGAYCVEKAKQICRALLACDRGRMIVSVCAEKCMYDSAAFAYKVIMRFTLREHEQHI